MCISSPVPVSDTVIVTSKHNEDKQYIWESDASQFSIVEDPRGDTLLRGTTVSLVLKEEAMEFLEPNTLRNLVEKYSQFINFPIYIWESKVSLCRKSPQLFPPSLPYLTSSDFSSLDSFPLSCFLALFLPHFQTETVEEPIEDEEEETSEGGEKEKGDEETSEGEEGEDETVEDEASVEEEGEEAEEKPKTRKVEKTTWDWVQVNNTRPIWLRR